MIGRRRNARYDGQRRHADHLDHIAGAPDRVVEKLAERDCTQAAADGGFDLPRAFERPETAEYEAVVTVADANGNGSADIVWSSPRGMWLLDLAGPASAGMLKQIGALTLGKSGAFLNWKGGELPW